MSNSQALGLPSRIARTLSVTTLAVFLSASCAEPPGGEPGDDPTPAPPLPAPEDQNHTQDEGDDGSTEEGATGDGPLGSRVVVIDPGHNGGNAQAPEEINETVPVGNGEKACDTVGAETAGGYAEHEFTWELSLLVQERLEADGATVLLTRQDDDGVGPCIDERADIGNDADADAALSIHADGGPESGRGFHVIMPGEVAGLTEEIVEPSQVLAEDIHREYLETTDVPVADYLADDGLDERTDLGGLTLSTVPKVFLEAANMRNPEDAALLENPEWRGQAADAIAKGLATYLMRE